jgi:NAD(P)H-hydrate epimerase
MNELIICAVLAVSAVIGNEHAEFHKLNSRKANDMTRSLTRDEARGIDQRAIAEYHMPGLLLMENAGRGVAELFQRLNPTREPATILCGPGNNGGDGFVIARHLDCASWPVTIVPMASEASVKGDAAVNLAIARAAKLNFSNQADLSTGWIIDALFGTGQTRAIESPIAELISALNASRRPVLAVDCPSGLDCETGVPLGPCVQATHTATFIARKCGFDDPDSEAFTGIVHVIEIGVPRALRDQYIK